ncbi:MAG: DMT family transporter [Tepidanaerobacteraceae bacterium]|nr:DMT family transporter [Tepidanaerobacteraceae bacterium]
MHCKNDLRPFLAGIFVSIIFGFSFLFTKEGLDVLEPFHLLGLRFALATIIFVIMRICGIIIIDLKGKNLGPLIILTLMEPVIYFICETIGINLTSSSEAGMIIALAPVFTVLLGVVYLKEKPTIVQSGFILLSVTGVIFMTIMKGNTIVGGNTLGTFILLGSVLSAGGYNVLSRKLSSEYSPVEITYVMMWVGAVVFNGISVIQHLNQGAIRNYFYPLTNTKALISIIYLGALSSIVAYFLLNYLLSQIQASRASVIANVATVISVTAGVIFRNEPLYWFNVAGGLMILCGVWGTNYYTKKDDVQEIHEMGKKRSPSRLG